jgi:hypothetical protein
MATEFDLNGEDLWEKIIKGAEGNQNTDKVR